MVGCGYVSLQERQICKDENIALQMELKKSRLLDLMTLKLVDGRNENEMKGSCPNYYAEQSAKLLFHFDDEMRSLTQTRNVIVHFWKRVARFVYLCV